MLFKASVLFTCSCVGITFDTVSKMLCSCVLMLISSSGPWIRAEASTHTTSIRPCSISSIFTFWNFPLNSFHRNSIMYSEAAAVHRLRPPSMSCPPWICFNPSSSCGAAPRNLVHSSSTNILPAWVRA